MVEIQLEAVPNQAFSVTLDGSRYDLTIKEAGGVMCLDLARDGAVLLQGSRLVALAPVIPYPHLQTGNFILATQDDDLPYYPAFGITQRLYYVSADEIAGL